MIYYDNNYLFCFGKLKNRDENKNYSEHLLGLNINTKRIKDYTPDIQLVDDLKLLSQINENEFLIQISSATISEDDISSYNEIYILDARKKSLNKYKIELDSPYIFSLSANKNEYIYLSNSRDNGNLKSSEKIIIIGRNNKEDTEILKTFQYYPSNFYSQKMEENCFYLENSKKYFNRKELIDILKLHENILHFMVIIWVKLYKQV